MPDELGFHYSPGCPPEPVSTSVGVRRRGWIGNLILAQPTLQSKTRREPRPRRSLRRLLLPLLVFSCLAAAPVWAFPGTTNKLHLLRPGNAVVADLDGDHVLDTASGVETGHSALGYFYRVDLALTGDSAAAPFMVLSFEPMGLNIEALDVDGDHDMDLVISSQFLRRPVGVWLNDGKGLFSPADPARYTPSLPLPSGAVSSANDPTPREIDCKRRPAAFNPRLTPITVRSPSQRFTPSPPSFRVLLSSPSPSRFRAPPFQLS